MRILKFAVCLALIAGTAHAEDVFAQNQGSKPIASMSGKTQATRSFEIDLRSLSRRGQDGNGGDAARGSANQPWSLLDLIENLEHDYFFPVSGLSYEDKTLIRHKLQLIEKMCNQFDGRKGPYFGGGRGTEMSMYVEQYLFGTRNFTERGDNERGDRFIGELTWVKTDQPLPEISDEGMVTLSFEAEKRQLAIQSGGIVLVHYPTYQSMTKKSKLALPFHEGLIAMVRAANPKHLERYGTSKIRRLVRLVFDENASKIPSSQYADVCGSFSRSIWD